MITLNNLAKTTYFIFYVTCRGGLVRFLDENFTDILKFKNFRNYKFSTLSPKIKSKIVARAQN